jgi:sulfite exporter TauE/SafE
MNSLPFALAFFWGLAGGFSHCIGMCGVFVVAYSGSPEPGKTHIPPIRHVLFHMGRLITLGLLGAIAGVLGGVTHSWATAAG